MTLPDTGRNKLNTMSWLKTCISMRNVKLDEYLMSDKRIGMKQESRRQTMQLCG